MTSNPLLQQPFTGIIVPMVTPLLDNKTLDEKGLEKLIERLIKGGVHGIFILGTTGEGTSLDYSLRKKLIDRTCRQVAGRVPIMVGITDSAPEESLALAKFSADAGAAAVVAAPPFYFSMEQCELTAYYSDLADQLPLPLYLYNMPSHTKINISPATVEALSGHPNIIGLKDSSGNAVYFSTVFHSLRTNPSFTVLVGPEEMMASSVLMGGHGGVNGGANIFPELYVDLYYAARDRDHLTVMELQQRVMEISRCIYGVGETGMSYLQGLKSALSAMGICSGFIAAPFKDFEQENLLQIEEHLKHLGYIKN